jgi:hypothetical protein
MAHLPIRRKPTKADPKNLLPMAIVLAIGMLATALIDGARTGPAELAHNFKLEITQQVVPMATQAFNQAMAAHRSSVKSASVQTVYAPPVHISRPEDLAGLSFELGGRSWVAAALPPIADFKTQEMQPQATFGAWKLFANRTRGVSALNVNAHAYDRLYVDLGAARFAALRWREVGAPKL